MVSSAAKSKCLAAAVQFAFLRPFRGSGRGGGGGIHSSRAWEEVQALSQYLSPPHPPKELHSNLGHTQTTLSKSTSGVASPGILSNFAKATPKVLIVL